MVNVSLTSQGKCVRVIWLHRKTKRNYGQMTQGVAIYLTDVGVNLPKLIFAVRVIFFSPICFLTMMNRRSISR